MQNLRRAVFAGLVAGTLSEGAAATAGDGGFVEDSELQFLARTYYFNRDYRDSPNNAGRNRFKPRSERNGYREEATQGLRLQFASGYTPGSLGFGLDAHAMLGLQLDSGGGRTGTGNLPVGADGHPDHRYGKVGGALRLRHGETRLKYGQTTTSAPVFAASSNRTLTGMAYGLLLEDRLVRRAAARGWALHRRLRPRRIQGPRRHQHRLRTPRRLSGAPRRGRLPRWSMAGHGAAATVALRLALRRHLAAGLFRRQPSPAAGRGARAAGRPRRLPLPRQRPEPLRPHRHPGQLPGPGLRTGAAAHHPGLPACPWRAAVRLHGLRRRALQRVHGTGQLGGLLRLQRTGRAFLAITL